jgi:plastocyanin
MTRYRLFISIVAVLLLAACASGDEATTTSESADTTTSAAEDVTTTVPAAETSTTAGSGGGQFQMTIVDFSFNGPASVPVGATIEVVNQDSFVHTWTSDESAFDSGSLSQGETFEFTFEEAGEYTFICAIHPNQMTGSILVEG